MVRPGRRGCRLGRTGSAGYWKLIVTGTEMPASVPM